MLNAKRFVLAALPALATIVAIGAASAQSWPTRPVTMTVPFAAGSSSDTAGRVLAVGLSEALGQQVIIENVGGGGGMTGTARVAKAAPDGYQFVFASVDSMAIVPTMHKRPLYNSVTDFTAAGLVVDQPIVLITRKDLPVNTLQEFVAYAKANQGKCSSAPPVSAPGRISPAQSSTRRSGSNRRMFLIGAPGLMQDLIAGRIDYFCAFGAAAMGPLEAGNAKAMALLTSERSLCFPR